MKWVAMENASRGTLANASEQVVNALNTQYPGKIDKLGTDPS